MLSAMAGSSAGVPKPIPIVTPSPREGTNALTHRYVCTDPTLPSGSSPTSAHTHGHTHALERHCQVLSLPSETEMETFRVPLRNTGKNAVNSPRFGTLEGGESRAVFG